MSAFAQELDQLLDDRDEFEEDGLVCEDWRTGWKEMTPAGARQDPGRTVLRNAS